ncbi:kinase-like protein [Lentinus brumalis]|uniref:Kinase-like protein n=1 Tax=Lentinus brumalis TaxID=2498619 RepID=A0A371D0R9_9APHY|nr:kinase-like protein [Polyporus brumalis]
MPHNLSGSMPDIASTGKMWFARYLPADVRGVFEPTAEAVQETLRLMAEDYTGLEGAGSCQSTFYNLGDGRLVKTGHRTSMEEAYAMVFVRAHTKIPVPQVFMVFQHAGLVHIVMELVKGTALREAVYYDADGVPTAGDGMVTNAQLQSIMLQLRGIVEELRDLGRRFAPTRPTLGSLTGGRYTNTYFLEDLPSARFEPGADFHAYWLKRVQPFKNMDGEAYEHLKRLARESALHPSRADAPRLTHGDLAPRNIIIEDGKIVAIVDWETFGWYPEFWEDMGIHNEVMPGRVREAIERVFGKMTDVTRTYIMLLSALRKG